MKKTILAIITLVLIIACNEKESDKNFELTGNIKVLKKGTLYIQRIVDTAYVNIDTIQINGDAHFQSNFNINSPEMLYLFLDRVVTKSLDNNLAFFAEPGKMNIETDLESFYAKAKITGSKNHDLLEDYKKVNSKFHDQLFSLTEAKYQAMKYNKAKVLDSIIREEERIIKRRYLYTVNYAVTNKDHEIAPYIALSEISDVALKYLDTIQKSMTPKVAQSLYGKKLTEYYIARKKEGK